MAGPQKPFKGATQAPGEHAMLAAETNSGTWDTLRQRLALPACTLLAQEAPVHLALSDRSAAGKL